jgi:hypothetical protein
VEIKTRGLLVGKSLRICVIGCDFDSVCGLILEERLLLTLESFLGLKVPDSILALFLDQGMVLC